jgi:hypothetical protein
MALCIGKDPQRHRCRFSKVMRSGGRRARGDRANKRYGSALRVHTLARALDEFALTAVPGFEDRETGTGDAPKPAGPIAYESVPILRGTDKLVSAHRSNLTKITATCCKAMSFAGGEAKAGNAIACAARNRNAQADGNPDGLGPVLRPSRRSSDQALSAPSAYENNSKSSGATIPSCTKCLKLINLRQ